MINVIRMNSVFFVVNFCLIENISSSFLGVSGPVCCPLGGLLSYSEHLKRHSRP